MKPPPTWLTLPRALATLLSGVLFGVGLSWSTMISPEVVLGFLRFEDAGLMLVMAGAAGLTALAYKGLPRWWARPLCGGAFQTQPAYWNRETQVGAAVFGIGWGLSGVCPGPALAALGSGQTDVWWALLGAVIGGLVHGLTHRAKS